MDTVLSRHYARLRHLRESFAEANERLVALLREADEHAADQPPPDGGWSPAQVGLHVARVTTRFAALIAGDVPGVERLPQDFTEREWSAIAGAIPARLRTSPAFMPPPHVKRMEAIAALEASAVRLAQALDTVTPERGANFGISSPLVGGAISVYQIAEWAATHVARHSGQVARARRGHDAGGTPQDAC